jgi:hypothetical protein
MAKMHFTFLTNFILNEVESWVIGLFSFLLFLVLVNWFQFGHVEDEMGFKRS